MRGLRIKYFVFSFLAMLSIVSFGFASWVSTSEFVNTILEGSIITDDIKNGNEYFVINNLTIFNYSKEGFVSEDGYLLKKGYITARIDLNINKSKQNFSEFNDLTIEVELKRDNLSSFINDKILLSPFVSMNNIEINTSLINSTINNYVFSFEIPNFKNYDDDVSIDINYIFNIIDREYYKNSIYEELNKNIDFEINILIYGK